MNKKTHRKGAHLFGYAHCSHQKVSKVKIVSEGACMVKNQGKYVSIVMRLEVS